MSLLDELEAVTVIRQHSVDVEYNVHSQFAFFSFLSAPMRMLP